MTNLKNLSENKLVELAKQGNTEAFEELISRYENKIYSLAYRILQDPQEAYDVLQETAISAFKNLYRFQQKSTFSTWLYRIALNFALMKKRQRKDEVLSSNDGELTEYLESQDKKNLTDWSSDPMLNLENKELRNVLEEALQKLPEKYRSVVILKDLENKPLAEISKLLNLSIPAVKTRLHRARLFLRQNLENYVKQVYSKKYIVSKPSQG